MPDLVVDVWFDFVGAGYFVTFLTILNIVLMIGFTAFSNWWLSFWLGQGNGVRTKTLSLSNTYTEYSQCLKNHIFSVFFPGQTSTHASVSDNPNLEFYQIIYGVGVIAMVLLAIIKCFFYTRVTLNAGCKLHDTMFRNVCIMWSVWPSAFHSNMNMGSLHFLITCML